MIATVSGAQDDDAKVCLNLIFLKKLRLQKYVKNNVQNNKE